MIFKDAILSEYEDKRIVFLLYTEKHLNNSAALFDTAQLQPQTQRSTMVL